MKTTPRLLLLCHLMTLILVLASGNVRANGPEIGFDAGSIFPVESQNVQLVEETVTARISMEGLKVNVSCDYVLRNLSDQDLTFTMGFVTHTAFMPTEYLQQPVVDYRNANFRVRQDAQQLTVTFAPVKRDRWADLQISVPDSLPVWDVSIPANSDARLSINYTAAWSGGGEGNRVSRYCLLCSLCCTLGRHNRTGFSKVCSGWFDDKTPALQIARRAGA